MLYLLLDYNILLFKLYIILLIWINSSNSNSNNSNNSSWWWVVTLTSSLSRAIEQTVRVTNSSILDCHQLLVWVQVECNCQLNLAQCNMLPDSKDSRDKLHLMANNSLTITVAVEWARPLQRSLEGIRCSYHLRSSMLLPLLICSSHLHLPLLIAYQQALAQALNLSKLHLNSSTFPHHLSIQLLVTMEATITVV